MHKEGCVVELEGEQISFFFEVLVEALYVWSKKGFENEEEKKECKRIVGMVNQYREEMEKIPNYRFSKSSRQAAKQLDTLSQSFK